METAYVERDRILAAHGFESYEAYLKSPVWAEKRRLVLLDGNRKCIGCHTRAGLQVHHKTYTLENLIWDSRVGMVVVCWRCHEKAEFLSDGSKASLEQANARLDLLASMPKAKPGKTPRRKGKKSKKQKYAIKMAMKAKRLADWKSRKNGHPQKTAVSKLPDFPKENTSIKHSDLSFDHLNAPRPFLPGGSIA